jgi:hypothetical protein
MIEKLSARIKLFYAKSSGTHLKKNLQLRPKLNFSDYLLLFNIIENGLDLLNENLEIYFYVSCFQQSLI